MTLAVIDIGTNTVLLLVARFDDRGTLHTLVYEQRVPRLGKGVDAHKNLHPDSMNRVIHVLDEYRTLLRDYEPYDVVVAGTSAVRDAENNEEFSRLIRAKTGFQLKILSGDEEALWTYRGAISGTLDSGNITVVDIGGGSTEITTGKRESIRNRASIDIGSVRLTERYFKSDPPTDNEIWEASAFIERELEKMQRLIVRGSALVGVAGTATSLAIIDQELKEFSMKAVTNYRLVKDRIDSLFERLRKIPSREIGRLSNVMQGRSDVITAGTLILQKLMTYLDFSEMIVSERGLRYGLAIREWERRIGKVSGNDL